MVKEWSARALYTALYADMGPRKWWPARSVEELLSGMVLIQNTNYKNVDRSLANLDARTHFGMAALLDLGDDELMDLIRPSGFYKNKSRYLRAVLTNHRDHFHEQAALPTAELRKRLRALPGVGNETADVILLHVYMRPVFVADSYARRLFKLLWGRDYTYEQLQKRVLRDFDFSVAEAQELHALIDDYEKLGLDAYGLAERPD
ncbi:endonuclease III domain-containing protein [Lacticaseibacillus songhuajiangensis]|uniref:endonuclease III domain-containing protein n=1 Tax=Lacticaseibacillus songhuajiangensis TaxID=1296539 RepID=UPI000F76FC26|nr:endonuclease III [Lacticaseibacillus songhuajiangensis]